MTDSATYNVVLSGNLVSGFEMEQVVNAFARLFKLPPEKASRIIGSQFVIKRDIGLQIARVYQEKLAFIGIETVLQPQRDPGELALEPMELAVSGDTGNAKTALAGGEMICPKCELHQPRAEECRGCGVIISKIPPPPKFTVTVEAEAPRPGAKQAVDRAASTGGNTGSFQGKWVIVSALLAVVVVLAWFVVA